MEKTVTPKAKTDTFDSDPRANIEMFLKKAFSELRIEKIDFTTEASSKEAVKMLISKSAQIEQFLSRTRALKAILSSQQAELKKR